MHVGSATVGARLRPLDGAVRPAAAGRARCRCGSATGCCCATRAARRVLGADVRDVDPPELRRRGAARQRAAELAAQPPGTAGAAADLARRRVVRADDFVAMGWPVPAERDGASGPWLLAAGAGRRARRRGCRDVGRRLPAAASAGARAAGRGAAPRRSSCPTPSWCPAVVRPPLVLREGRVVDGDGRRCRRRCSGRSTAIRARLAADPFAAPEAPRPGRRRAGAARAGGRRAQRAAGPDRRRRLPRARASRTRPGPGWPALPQPFTLSQARQAWGTSRRVAVPLMEWLDARGVTVRLPDNTRRLR